MISVKQVATVAVATLMGFAASATDFTWANASESDQFWHKLSNWNVGDEAATDLPTNKSDTVTLPKILTSGGHYRARCIKLMTVSNTASIASIAGVAAWQLCLNSYSTGYGYANELDFTVSDINDYLGEWSATGTKKTLILNAASGTQTLQSVDVTQQFAINVTNAATTADMLQVRGTAGSIKKLGPGDLRIRNVAEKGNLVLELEVGNVQLDGVAKDASAPTDILAKSAVWFDASKASTWEDHTFVEGGRTFVTNWLDAAGRSAKAEIWDNSKDGTGSHIKTINPPFISTTTSSTGLQLMDFGAKNAANEGTYGPQALMRLNSRIASAEEVFYVAALNDGLEVVGDDTGADYNASETYVLTAGGALVDNGGFARFNGIRSWQKIDCVGGNTMRMVRTFDSYTAATTDLMLSNFRQGDGKGKPIHFLASDRLYSTAGNGSGGVKIGEVIIFTTALTDEERAEVTEYLMRKWFTKADHKDFHLVNAAKDTSITVPEGRVARVDVLRVTEGTTFTKKGAGTLQIGRVYPEDLTFNIEGGDIKLETQIATDVVSAPVGTPQMWFDAEADNAFETSGDNVTAWCDCRDATVKTTRHYPAVLTEYPHKDTTALAGHTVLTFPKGGSSTLTGAAFTMPKDKQRESFVVFSYTENVLAYNVLSSGYATDRSGGGVSGLFAKYSTAPDEMGGGIYTLDGKPVRPFEDTGSHFVAGEWYVANLATTAPLSLTVIGSNGPRSAAGNISVAEIITYDTELTAEQRRQNIDYLMKKWLNRRHPEYAAPAGDSSLAYSGSVTLDGNATYAAVSGSGTLTKESDGDITVTTALTDDFTALDLKGGSLTITKNLLPPDRSCFRFDISDASTLTQYFIDENGKTNVVKLADANGSDIYAYCKGWDNYILTTNPIIEQVEMRTGVMRPTMDMLASRGRYVVNNVKLPDPTPAAGLNIVKKYNSVREAHVIFSDRGDDAKVIFGADDVVSSPPFNRGGNRHLFASSVDSTGTKAWASVQQGRIWVDGETATCSTSLPSGFHLISLVPTDDVPLTTIARERNITNGGNYQSELVCFREVLPDAERAYLMRSLMHKWFGEEEPVWTNEFASISMVDGSALTVAGGAIGTPTLTGGGTITASEVRGIETLNLTAPDARTVNGLTVNGTADLAGAVTVNLAGGANLKAGSYTLVAATTLKNVDVSQWTVSPLPAKGTHTVTIDGNAVKLNITKPGMYIIVR